MVLEALAATNFALGAYDAWLTQKRMKAFGLKFELNNLVKFLATRMGPELASVVGVLGPCVGWTYIFIYFNLPIAIALMVGWGLKRFEIQLTSRVFAKAILEMQNKIKDFGESASTLHAGESTSKDSPSKSNEPTVK